MLQATNVPPAGPIVRNVANGAANQAANAGLNGVQNNNMMNIPQQPNLFNGDPKNLGQPVI
jgi:hypothetical protein